MVKVSEIAAVKLKEIIEKKKNSDNQMLRIVFGGFGWGGPRLELTLDELKKPNDVVVESQGITVVYDSNLEDHVRNSVVDYANSWFERGFVIRGARSSSC